MIPKQNQQVKLYFRNGLVEEGIVISWSEQRSVLKSLSSDNLLIIQNTANDIVAVKVFISNNQKPVSADQGPIKPVYIDEELKLPTPERDMTLRALKLGELRLKRGEEERARARALVTTFRPSGNFSLDTTERYAQPTPFNLDPPKKIRSSNTRHNK